MAFHILKPKKLTFWEKFRNIFHNVTQIRHSLELENIIDAQNEERENLFEDINDLSMIIFKISNNEMLEEWEQERCDIIHNNVKRERKLS